MLHEIKKSFKKNTDSFRKYSITKKIIKISYCKTICNFKNQKPKNLKLITHKIFGSMEDATIFHVQSLNY
jgi:hypothetical protein